MLIVRVRGDEPQLIEIIVTHSYCVHLDSRVLQVVGRVSDGILIRLAVYKKKQLLKIVIIYKAIGK